jgi:adenylate kinase family enzyme
MRPLFEYYGRAGLLSQIDGIGRPEEIQQRIVEALGDADATPKAPRG